ncbi:Beta-barrel assembly machine subunit BamC [Marinobacter daqiaonensis]|uniref:Beta-barrel assembly machine subunit BamC n=1 Tax=Marinobacter daqiaonensis TaxID=650891 RepID=A0A1I6H1E6_9GAMM|nr:outer membrane protein assembly factor BamC [Marinobacter daqiaonensis]SFR48147.1 Beta-barrel assembly machine subunit BamC [Marinobacter daqiaonensis]
MTDRKTDLSPVRKTTAHAATPAVLAIAVLMAGCSLVQDRGDDYANARAMTPVHGIDGEPLPRQNSAFPVRPLAENGGTLSNAVPKPPDMTAEILDENYVIESIDDQSWLLVNDVPGRIWPAVAAWMNETGLGVAYDSTQLGLMQSELVNYSRRARGLVGLEQGAGDEPLMLVQVRLAPGVRRKTTEIQVRPRTVDETPGRLIAWQDTPEDQQLEESLLQNLSRFIQGREESRSYSRAAMEMGSDPRVTLREADAEQERAVVIDLDYSRAWAEIRRVLEDEGIPVLDLDQSAGYFLVDGRPAEDRRRSWLTRWFAGDEVKPVVTNRIQLTQQDGQVVVTADRADDFDGGNYSRSLLNRLYEYLY